jgi:pyruvate dehydrogenase E1 component
VAPYLLTVLAQSEGPVVAASDYVRALPDSIARYVPATFVALGTDGFGRSEDRQTLRDFFEVDRRHIAYAAISALVRDGGLPKTVAERARRDLAIDVGRLAAVES